MSSIYGEYIVVNWKTSVKALCSYEQNIEKDDSTAFLILLVAISARSLLKGISAIDNMGHFVALNERVGLDA